MNKSNALIIRNLYASVEKKIILQGVSLTIYPGQVHAIMGPNGSGKSTLAYVLMGHPSYKCQMPNAKCQIKLGSKSIIDLPTEERAKLGLFLAFQSPIAIAGVTVVSLLRSAYQALHGDKKNTIKTVQNPLLARRWSGGNLSLSDFTKRLKEYADFLHINESFLHRGINEAFSGGERKKMEMLQALVLAPKFAIFDEIDTGLDVDALKIVASAIQRLKQQGSAVIVITHYQRILKYIKPDVVYIFIDGKIVDHGDATLAKKIEEKGYSSYATISKHH